MHSDTSCIDKMKNCRVLYIQLVAIINFAKERGRRRGRRRKESYILNQFENIFWSVLSVVREKARLSTGERWRSRRNKQRQREKSDRLTKARPHKICRRLSVYLLRR